MQCSPKKRPAIAHEKPDFEAKPPSNAIELELMHHYTLWTYKTCNHGAMTLSWWQETLPVMAMQHDHLLFALLAFTALHVAYLRPKQAAKYTSLAICYRDRALKILPTLFNRLDAEQADACFWSSALVGLICLATYQQKLDGGRPEPITVLLELSALWKGAEAVGDMVTTVTGQKCAPESPAVPMPASLPDDELRIMIDKARQIVNDQFHNDTAIRQHYLSAIDDVALACTLFELNGSIGGILAWSPCLHARIVGEIRLQTPLAALLVMVYGVVLDKLRNMWFIQDLGCELVHELSSSACECQGEAGILVAWARASVRSAT